MCLLMCKKGTRPDGLSYDFYNNGKVTKATLNGVTHNFSNAAFRIANNSKYFGFFSSYETLLPDTFNAKTKLHPDDSMNTEVAKEIVHGRVMEKYHRAFDKRMRDVVEDCHRMLAGYYHYCKKKGIDLSTVKSVDKFLEEYRQ